MKKLLFVLLLLISTLGVISQTTLHVSKFAIIAFNEKTKLWEKTDFLPTDLDFQQERYKISVNDHNKSIYNLIEIIGVSSKYTTWSVIDKDMRGCDITISKSNDIPVFLTVFYDNVHIIYYISSVRSPETTSL